MNDSIRPKGTVEVPCSGIGCIAEDGSSWHFWIDALDPRLPTGPFICTSCLYLENVQRATGRAIKQVLEHHEVGKAILYVFADNGEPVPTNPEEKSLPKA